MGIWDFHPGDVVNTDPILKTVQFDTAFTESPTAQVLAASAGDKDGGIAFTVGDHGATRTEIRFFAQSPTPSATANIRISWIACGECCAAISNLE